MIFLVRTCESHFGLLRYYLEINTVHTLVQMDSSLSQTPSFIAASVAQLQLQRCPLVTDDHVFDRCNGTGGRIEWHGMAISANQTSPPQPGLQHLMLASTTPRHRLCQALTLVVSSAF